MNQEAARTDSDAIVELCGISKSFGGARALINVDLTVARNSIHALVGENGAGKSTLGKIIAGIHQPDRGELVVNSDRATWRSPRDALASGIAIISQEPTLVPQRSVEENVFLGVEAKRGRFLVDTVRVRDRYRELSERLGFDLPASARVGTLRLGDQQKVEIMRAVARDAKLIVMDEPTAALSKVEADRLLADVRGLRRAGMTVIYISHFLEEVLQLVDQVTVLRDGKIVRNGPASAETPSTLVSAMVGRPVSLAFPPKSYPSSDAPVILSVRGLTQPGVIEDVSFDVRRGEIVALAGLIGSGRSEVARAIFGADRLARGTITVRGRPVTIREPRDATRIGVVMVPEDRKGQGLVMGRSILENVTLPHLDRFSWAGIIDRRSERAEGAVAVKNLDVRYRQLSAPVASLSGGNQQKVLFARWLVVRPHVLLADEPTRGVDVGAKLAIYQLLCRLAQEGMGILLISSELEEVLGIGHRILVMRRGRITAEFDGQTATEGDVMRAAFGTSEDDAGDLIGEQR